MDLDLCTFTSSPTTTSTAAKLLHLFHCPSSCNIGQLCIPQSVTWLIEYYEQIFIIKTLSSSLEHINITPVLKRAIKGCLQQLHSYPSFHNRFDLYQSGFRANHSTETALIKIINDVKISSTLPGAQLHLELHRTCWRQLWKHNFMYVCQYLFIYYNTPNWATYSLHTNSTVLFFFLFCF